MKKMISTVAVLICLLACTITFSACGINASAETGENKDAGPAAVCYAIAPTANSKGLNFNSPLVNDMSYDVILHYGYISAVVIDGNSEVVGSTSYDLPEQYKHASRVKLETDARAKTANLITYLTNQQVNDPQVDYLQGLQIAARSMNALDGYSSKTIVMIGTGLSTQGIMNFKNNLLSVEPEAVIDMLEEKEEIPDLSGITVVWQQLGDVAAPQQELSQRQYKRLEELWGGIVERGGGEFVYNEIMPLPANEDASFPEVDVVDLPAEAPIAFSEDMFESEDENTLDQPVMLTEKQVRFVPDSASYLDEKSALKTIRPIADYLVKYDQKSILLAGTTAGDEDNEESRVLSQKRAETVKASLVAMGINESRIQTIGLGSSDPWHVPGAGFDGPIASGNRKVVIMDISSDDARKILDN